MARATPPPPASQRAARWLWAAGAYVPGVPGFRSASAGEGYISFEVGSGQYALALSLSA